MFYTNVESIGSNIYSRIVDNSGKRFSRKESFNPSFFIHPNNNEKAEWSTIHGDPLAKIQLGSIGEAREWIKQNKDVSNFEIFGNTKYQYQYIAEKFSKEISWNRNHIKIYNIDIETAVDGGFSTPEEARNEVTSITIECKDKFYVWGTGDFKTSDPNICYHRADNEREMLEHFMAFWAEDPPDVVTGWNNKFFDIPYLINRISQFYCKPENIFSPYRKIHSKEVRMYDKAQKYYDILGVSIIDYLELYKKFTYTTRENYRLDFIAHVELGERKLNHDQIQAGYLLYKSDYQKFIEYNIQDVKLVKQLDEKLNLLELIFTMAYKAKCNYQDVFSQVRTWDCIIYNHLNEKNVAIPFGNSKENRDYEGAYVKEPIPGRKRWVASFDFKSLYPNILRALNISPETIQTHIDVPDIFDISEIGIPLDLHNQVKKFDFSLASNGWMYSKKTIGFMPEIVGKLFDERTSIKKEIHKLKLKNKNDPKISSLNVKQMAIKIQLNSLYGAMGNEHFRFYDVNNAEAITLTGQTLIRWVENKFHNWLPEIKAFYCDTDSCVGSTIVFANGNEESIEDLYERIETDVQEHKPGKFLKNVKEISTKSFDKLNKSVEDKEILKIFKHKVKKEMFEISYQNKKVVVTGDHSIIIERNSKILDISAKNIKKGDKIMVLKK